MAGQHNPLPETAYLAAQVRELDRIAIEEFSIPGITLMERAGLAAFQLMKQRWPQAKNILVLCGPGNNGGDGYILARLALNDGYDVKLRQVGDHSKLKGDTLLAADQCWQAGFKAESFQESDLNEIDVIVDGLLGTGLDRTVGGQWREVINSINLSNIPVLSLDIPSGFNADTGEVMGVAVKAEATMTFIGMKQGMLKGAGGQQCGEIFFDQLGVPDEVYEQLKI